jgi:hypothetical protein
MSRARDLGSSINSTAAGKNLVINGNFEISQRHSTPSTLAYYNSSMFFVDRWCPHQFQSAMYARTSIAAGSGPSSRYALRVGSVSISQEGYGSRLVAAQKIESVNTYPLRGHRVTLSFWVRFSNSNFTSLTNSTDSTYGNFSYSIGYNTTTTDAPIGSTGSDSANYVELANNNSTGSLPTSWTKITLNGTVPLDANNILVRFGFNALGSSTSAGQYWYEIADVQLEKGSSATPFSLAGGDIQGELAKCQRYYWRVQNVGPYTHMGFGAATNTASAGIFIKTPVTMRISPSSIEFSTLAIQDVFQSLYPVIAATIDQVGNEVIGVVATASGTPLTQYRPMRMVSNNSTSGYIAFNAEI